KLLVIQAIAFLILVALLAKFVYPALIKAIDDRRSQIEEGLKEAKEGQEALAKAEAKVTELMEQARKDADEILARAHQESTSQIAEAEATAKKRAEQIVKDARTQLDAEVAKARVALKRDTVQLVAMATERIVNEKLDERKDANLIKESLAQAEKS